MADLNLPPRFFACGEEPVGERVISYHKIQRTKKLIEALDEDELAFFQTTQFSKILVIDDSPPFSGAFCHFVCVRTLKTKNIYEIWVVFAGYPIRISLQEFAIVTGLNCDRVQQSKRKKRKNPLHEKLYWNDLFGSFKSCHQVIICCPLGPI